MHDDLDFDDLVPRAREGDNQARTELYRRTAGAVRATAMRVAHPRDVDDVAQEAFVRAFSHLHALRDPQAFPAWVTGIARRLAVDTHRHLARVTPRDELPELVDDLADPALLAASHERSARAVEGLRELPEREREALILRDGYAVGVEEIAQRLDLSRGATRTLLYRARKRAATVLSGALSVLPATLVLRLRRTGNAMRHLATPLPMTATAAAFSLATLPLVESMIHQPFQGEARTTATLSAHQLAVGRSDVLGELAMTSLAELDAPTRKRQAAQGARPLGELDDFDPGDLGPIHHRRDDDNDITLVIRHSDGSEQTIGVNLPGPVTGTLDEKNDPFGHTVVVDLGALGETSRPG